MLGQLGYELRPDKSAAADHYDFHGCFLGFDRGISAVGCRVCETFDSGVSKREMFFLWKDRGSDFSVGPMKLRRTYLVANEEDKNEQLTRTLSTYLGIVNSWKSGNGPVAG